MRLHIVGQRIRDTDVGMVWRLLAIFQYRQDAEAACRSKDMFVAPMPFKRLIQPLAGADPVPGCYFPRRGRALTPSDDIADLTPSPSVDEDE